MINNLMKKKIISTFIAGVTAISSSCYSLNYFSAFAVDEPVFYFKSGEDTDIIKISSEDVANGDVTLRIGMYIDDSSNDIGALMLKWECDSDYIKLGNLLSPAMSVGESQDYILPDGTVFSSDSVPTCFGSISKGKYYFQGTFRTADKPNSDTGRSETAYSAMYQSEMWNAPVWLADDSDAYMISDFDAVISQGTPDGFYKIYYVSSESDDISSLTAEEFNQISYGTYYSTAKDFLPVTKSITIQVGEPPEYTLGDINNDSIIDAGDASQALRAYASNAGGEGYGLTENEFLSADVNKDGIIDASDASRILRYYANTASNIKDSFDIE